MQVTTFSALVTVLALASTVADVAALQSRHRGTKNTKRTASAPARLAVDTDSDVQRWLYAHNSVRLQYQAPNVTWSENLVTAAQAETNTCVFSHTVNNQYGENIAAGYASIEDVVDGWVNGGDEKSAYDPANPTYSHFTQVIWANTKEIGCAVTTCANLQDAGMQNTQFWACEYNPPGNYVNEFKANVKAGKGGVALPS